MVTGRGLAVMKSRCAGKVRAIWKLINCFQIVELRNNKKLEETIFVTQR